MDEPSIAFNINDGRTFFADEISITNNPLKIIIDFKNTAPRIDVRAEQGLPVVLEHNAVMMDPFLCKTFHKILGEHLKVYEKQFGKITEPSQLKKAKKAEQQQAISHATAKKPGYFG